jgi:pyruvate dehydrogenase (quinone)
MRASYPWRPGSTRPAVNPDFCRGADACGLQGFRAEHPDEVEGAIKAALVYDGPALVDCVTNPDEVAVPPKPSFDQMRGFAIAKTREFLDSAE